MDYYNILGVSRGSTYAEIKGQYKKLALKYHPDKNPKGNTEENFKKITEAYKTLSDPYSRGKYDAMLERGEYDGIDDKFGMNFTNAMNMFNNIFRNDPFFSQNFRVPEINIPTPHLGRKEGIKSYSSSYSSSTFQSRDKDGKVRTKKSVQVSRNGQKDKYETEYYIDKDGRKYIIKDEGNRQLLSDNNNTRIAYQHGRGHGRHHHGYHHSDEHRHKPRHYRLTNQPTNH